jgi:hypothetical protein
MFIKKFNRLTEDEFVLLKGTDKMVEMITNKYYTDSHELVDWLDENATGTFCVVKHNAGWILYLESANDIMSVRQYCEPELVDAPPIHSINIVNET